MNAINRELYFWGLYEVSIIRYRCIMPIFLEILSTIAPLYDEKYFTLEKCCEYFWLQAKGKIFHNALFDSFMPAKLMSKKYDKNDETHVLFKEFNYYKKESLDVHYYIYKKQKIENHNNNDYIVHFSFLKKILMLLILRLSLKKDTSDRKGIFEQILNDYKDYDEKNLDD